MLQKLFGPAGALLLAAALVFRAPALTSAAPPGGSGPRSGYAGAYHGGHRGGHYGGNRVSYYGYRPSDSYRPSIYLPSRSYLYSFGYPYTYGPYPYGSYPYRSAYYPDYGSGGYGGGPEGATLPMSAMSSPVTARARRPAPAPAQPDAPATVTLSAPASADVWFDEWKVPARTTKLTTPPLKPGRKYTYQVRAAWWQGGRNRTETRDVTVTAGEHVRVTFPAPTAAPAKKGD
jgi:uncharacterized protein (TIGR03000 family)